MCCSVINASEMQTAMQVVVFFSLLFLSADVCANPQMLLYTVEPQHRNYWHASTPAVSLLLGNLEFYCKGRAVICAKTWGKTARRRPNPPETGATSRAKKTLQVWIWYSYVWNESWEKKPKNLKYKRVYVVWNSVWVGFRGRGPSSNHSHRLSVVSMLWLITVTFSVCSSLCVNVCQKKTF